MKNELSVHTDQHYMRQAYREAEKALECDEVPVGAVIVSQNTIIARSHNQTEMLTDVTAHAEILAITAAATHLGTKFLDACTLYVTLEPCPMCAGAIRHARFNKVVYGAADERHGFMRYGKEMLHPSTSLEYGVLHDECAGILQHFFARKRLLQH